MVVFVALVGPYFLFISPFDILPDLNLFQLVDIPYNPKNDLIIVATTTRKMQLPNQAAATLLVS